MMTMRKATASDFDRLFSIILDCAEWVQKKGLLIRELLISGERFLRDINAGTVWGFDEYGDAIGTVTIYSTRPAFYQETVWDDGLTAWYLGRLAVSRRFIHHNCGSRIIRSLEFKANNDLVPRIRFHVPAENGYLKEFSHKQGYSIEGRGKVLETESLYFAKEL